ncbi:MAG TPA: outer membrane lipoprotein carrier protein LolA [Gammaproteobacteria bacterium]|nr:outer membrane lipoprotein carrier protein LolA [Gammaproteobacteria bacterium]
MLSNRLTFTVLLALCSISLALSQELPQTQLSNLLRNVNTMSAKVQQLIVESDGAVLEESSIQMHLLRPGGFYWETLEPFPELVVTDGTLLWNYQPDLEQVVIEDWDSSRSELAAELLGGRTDRLAAEYEVIKEDSNSENMTIFKLLPLDGNSLYQRINISFEKELLFSIHLDNKNGQKTLWQFKKPQVNHQLTPGLFRFQIPQGIDIVDNRAIAE